MSDRRCEAVIADFERCSRRVSEAPMYAGGPFCTQHARSLRSTPSGTPPETVQLSHEEWAQAVKAMEKARSRFHGLSAAVAVHRAGEGTLDLEQLEALLQDGNVFCAAALSALRAAGERKK